MKIHVLSIPMYPTKKEITLSAFVQKVYKFCDFMKQKGHEVIHYGHPDSEVNCSEHVNVITKEDHRKQYGDRKWQELLPQETNNELHKTFNINAAHEIYKRSDGPKDIICAFWGFGHRDCCDSVKAANKGIIVEASIGYNSSFTENRVFESYAQMHKILGMDQNHHPSFVNQVIQPCFYPEDFQYEENKENYYLYLGRMIDPKGITIAQNIAKMTKTKIKFVGPQNTPNSLDKKCPYSEFIDTVSIEDRKKLLSKAKCLIAPTLYVEPCGWIIMEAMFSGTPVITTDFGGFSEYNLNGVTGFRCKSMNEFLHSAINIKNIKSENCRKYAEYKFNVNKVANLYENYFNLLINGVNYIDKFCNFTCDQDYLF